MYPKSKNLSESVKSFNEFKKWSSMQIINDSMDNKSPDQQVYETVNYDEVVGFKVECPSPIIVKIDAEPITTSQKEDVVVVKKERPKSSPTKLEATGNNGGGGDIRSNMFNVLEEIKSRDHAKSQQLLTNNKPKRIELDKIHASLIHEQMNNEDLLSGGHVVKNNGNVNGGSGGGGGNKAVIAAVSMENKSHLVRKLKQKFDNKDQNFIKVRLLKYSIYCNAS